jgi:hypothetical protein
LGEAACPNAAWGLTMWGLIFSGLMKWFDPATIINGAINAYVKAKDVDLEKFKTATPSLEHAVVAVLDANVKFAQIQSNYNLAILNWWPFRVILFGLLFFPSMHFIAIIIDSTCPIAWNLHMIGGKSVGGCGWGIPDADPKVFDIYKQMLLFFILVKPVDTVVAGGINVLSRYLDKK